MTVDLKIERPIQISMNMVEIEEERFPSFKMELKCKVPHPTGFFIYEADDIWFECHAWDTFNKELSQLISGSVKSATLADLSDYFHIDIKAHENSYLFHLNCHEPETGEGATQLEYKILIDNDTIGTIKRGFSSFPAWW